MGIYFFCLLPSFKCGIENHVNCSVLLSIFTFLLSWHPYQTEADSLFEINRISVPYAVSFVYPPIAWHLLVIQRSQYAFERYIYASWHVPVNQFELIILCVRVINTEAVIKSKLRSLLSAFHLQSRQHLCPHISLSPPNLNRVLAPQTAFTLAEVFYFCHDRT